MARPKCERKKTNISIDPALYDDVLKLVEGGDYRNVSHFLIWLVGSWRMKNLLI